jgi:hypothetical protein
VANWILLRQKGTWVQSLSQRGDGECTPKINKIVAFFEE